MAAIARQSERGDAGDDAWLRADPCYVRAEMSGVRLMGHGAMGLDADGADALLAALRPLFGDAGFALDATAPGRWYLRLSRATPLPEFIPPDEALGADVYEYEPQGPEGRRWRALANEAQVTLHNHPCNAARVAAGLPPLNSLWFWGGGVLPHRVECAANTVVTEEPDLRALARASGVADAPEPAGSVLTDLRTVRDWAVVERHLRGQALPALRGGNAVLHLDFADGARLALRPGHRWRFWRRPRDPRT
jgi:hypothetical protein